MDHIKCSNKLKEMDKPTCCLRTLLRKQQVEKNTWILQDAVWYLKLANVNRKFFNKR